MILTCESGCKLLHGPIKYQKKKIRIHSQIPDGQNFHTEDQQTGVTIKDVVVRYLCIPALSILRLNEEVGLDSTGSV